MDEAEVVETLSRLGLSTYEARTFVALQRLGTGSASEVADVTDVPRSQVYGAAEGLERRGLIDVQQGTPTRYRPVSLADARTRLLERLEQRGERAFEHLESVRGDLSVEAERSEAIWIVQGRESVGDRTLGLVADAEHRIVYGAPTAAVLDDRVLDALRERAREGLEVVVVSNDEAVLAAVGDDAGVESHRIPGMSIADLRAGRTVLVDRDVVLLSVLGNEGSAASGEETAFWSERSAFARMLVSIVASWIGSMLAEFDPDGGVEGDG